MHREANGEHTVDRSAYGGERSCASVSPFVSVSLSPLYPERSFLTACCDPRVSRPPSVRIAILLARCKSSEQFVLSPVIRAPLHRAVRNAAASANGVGKRARLGGSLNLVDFVHRRVALRRRSII